MSGKIRLVVDIIIFVKFTFQNGGKFKLGVISFNLLSKPGGNIALRWVCTAMWIEMGDYDGADLPIYPNGKV